MIQNKSVAEAAADKCLDLYRGANAVFAVPVGPTSDPIGYYIIGLWQKGGDDIHYRCNLMAFDEKDSIAIVANRDPGVESALQFVAGDVRMMDVRLRELLLVDVIRPAIAHFHNNATFDPSTTLN